MAVRTRTTYQNPGGLEQAVVDLVAAGVQGQVGAVRQVAARLMRNVPPLVESPPEFQARVHEAMTMVPPVGARSAAVSRSAGPSAIDLLERNDFPVAPGLVVPGSVMAELDEIIAEHARRDVLSPLGLEPTRSVLLHGAPGVGKTMAATWLAEHLGLGLVTLNLASVVSSLLGSTGRNLRSALDEAASSPVVLLIDEFDALAKRRDDLTDVGELKRIVNVLLLELDRWPSSSLLVAATNHRQLLDVAIERRFDRIVELMPPNVEDRERMLVHFLGSRGETDVRVRGVASATSGWTGSDLRRLFSMAARRSALTDTDIRDQILMQVLDQMRPGALRDTVWLRLSDDAWFTNRQIAQLSGVSHPTVGAGIKRARRGHE